jgi:hypothetical protein
MARDIVRREQKRRVKPWLRDEGDKTCRSCAAGGSRRASGSSGSPTRSPSWEYELGERLPVLDASEEARGA